MNASVEKAQFAWQPLTVRGVAAFARASLGRLLLVQFIVALLAAGTVVWFLHKAWFPTIGEAIRRLPPQGEIRSGRLDWQGATPARLAEGRFLAIAVDLDHTGEARSPAHVQVEFGRTDCKVFSLLGYVQGAYPRGWAVAFNRTELGPWWGAWAPAILAIVAGLVVAGSDGELGVPGDGVLSAGVAGRVLREPGLEPARELAPGGRGADAGGAVDVRRHLPVRLGRVGPRAAGGGGSRAFGDGLGLSVRQPPVLAAASGGGGEGQSVRVIACCAPVRLVSGHDVFSGPFSDGAAPARRLAC